MKTSRFVTLVFAAIIAFFSASPVHAEIGRLLNGAGIGAVAGAILDSRHGHLSGRGAAIGAVAGAVLASIDGQCNPCRPAYYSTPVQPPPVYYSSPVQPYAQTYPQPYYQQSYCPPQASQVQAQNYWYQAPDYRSPVPVVGPPPSIYDARYSGNCYRTEPAQCRTTIIVLSSGQGRSHGNHSPRHR
jgi:hypothetical protein